MSRDAHGKAGREAPRTRRERGNRQQEGNRGQ